MGDACTSQFPAIKATGHLFDVRDDLFCPVSITALVRKFPGCQTEAEVHNVGPLLDMNPKSAHAGLAGLSSTTVPWPLCTS